MTSEKLLIQNKLGLHARAAARLVSTASGYAAHIELTSKGRTVNAKSIMGVMMLAAAKGSEIEVSAKGEDESDALSAIVELVNDKFGEGE